MKGVVSVFVGAALLLVVVSAVAHHSFTAEFDIKRPIEFTGTVTEIKWTNPHAWFYVEVEDDDGNVQNWAIELLGINTLMRRGWTRKKIQSGDILIIEGFGARDGSNTGNASVITVASTGEQIWGSTAGENN
jgi:hypothetical protein